MDTISLFAGLLIYVFAGRVLMRQFTGGVREFLFAALNVTGVFLFLFYGGKEHFVLRFAMYLALIWPWPRLRLEETRSLFSYSMINGMIPMFGWLGPKPVAEALTL